MDMSGRIVVLLFAVVCLHAPFPLSDGTLTSTEPSTPSPGSLRCPQVEGNDATCACQHPDGIIDLTPLSFNNGTPRFTNLEDSNGYSYKYNPCTPYKSEVCSNKDVFSCQKDGNTGYVIADGNKEEMWIDEDGVIFLYYSGDQKRKTKVTLQCDQLAVNTTITTTGDSITALTYLFDITSCHVCPGGCSNGNDALSITGIIGIVIILVAILGIITYFVAGALIMKFQYQATGTDIIPNKTFWFQLPLLVKDGCVWTFGPPVRFIREKVKREPGYQKM